MNSNKPRINPRGGPPPTPSQLSTSTALEPQPLESLMHPAYQALRGLPVVIVPPEFFANAPQGQSHTETLTPSFNTNFQEDMKPLGAMQISIGLVHIGFGVILGFISINYEGLLGFTSIAFISGYPFWGGLFFIVSGVLSVSTTKTNYNSLEKSNIGMNIISAIFAVAGVILLLVDSSGNVDPQQDYWAVIAGKGISAIMIIFSLLEFCITVATTYFTYRAGTTPDTTNKESPKNDSAASNDTTMPAQEDST